MRKAIEEIIKLAKDWRDYSEKSNGWNTVTYGCGVWCYFSIGREHTSVHIEDNGIGCIEVAFHRIVKFTFSNPAMINAESINKITIKYRKILNEFNERYKKVTEVEKEQNRLDKIKHLESQLKDLK